jgi:hypothetical protein
VGKPTGEGGTTTVRARRSPSDFGDTRGHDGKACWESPRGEPTELTEEDREVEAGGWGAADPPDGPRWRGPLGGRKGSGAAGRSRRGRGAGAGPGATTGRRQTGFVGCFQIAAGPHPREGRRRRGCVERCLIASGLTPGTAPAGPRGRDCGVRWGALGAEHWDWGCPTHRWRLGWAEFWWLGGLLGAHRASEAQRRNRGPEQASSSVGRALGPPPSRGHGTLGILRCGQATPRHSLGTCRGRMAHKQALLGLPCK